MSGNVLFPDEILVEILHRLPSKSILRCSAVCKSWRSLISNESFISLHRRHSPSFLLLGFSNKLFLPHRRHHHDPSLTLSYTLLRLPSFPDLEFPVLSFCNGLICIAYGERCLPIIICNPSIRRYVCLPTPHDYPCYYNSCIALGFDSTNCDYKVIRISCIVDDESFGLSAPLVELYSLKSGSWRILDGIAPVCYVAGDAPHGFEDGLVHWVAKRDVTHSWYYFLLTFRLEDEMFGEVMLPGSLAHVSSVAVVVKVVGGGNGKTLTVYHVSACYPCSCEIWVMKEYGVVESWNKVFSFSMNAFCLVIPSLEMTIIEVAVPPAALCVTHSGEVLLLVDVAGRRCLYSLDMERTSFTELQIEVDTEFVYSGYYAESLVLLNNASGAVSY
ncbi:hypothetical protein JHK87_028605 [Glycine soja]|nr:hypothetical protein JHK87_028605 [Glycine soja]